MEDIEDMLPECVEPLLLHAYYMFGFNGLVRDFRDAKEKLILRQKSVKERMEEALWKAEIVEESVETWMNDVDYALKDVEQVEEKIKHNKGCYRVPFRYFLAKEVDEATLRMLNLECSWKLETFSRPIELLGMTYFVYSKSFMHAYNKLMETLKDGKHHMIGLHGLKGSGKTKLVIEVMKKADELQLFENIVMVVVTPNPEVTNIQNRIAESVNLILTEKKPFGRVQQLSTRLQDKRTLVIFDDVWENFVFEFIGIPPCCTVLLTSRSRGVCVSLNCQIMVELSLMDEEEAWSLFKSYADIIEDSPYALKLKDVPRKIVKKFKGLPFAIVAMASMLRGERVEKWEVVLHRLEESEVRLVLFRPEESQVCERNIY